MNIALNTRHTCNVNLQTAFSHPHRAGLKIPFRTHLYSSTIQPPFSKPKCTTTALRYEYTTHEKEKRKKKFNDPSTPSKKGTIKGVSPQARNSTAKTLDAFHGDIIDIC